MSELKKVELEDGRKVEVAGAGEREGAATLVGEAVTVVGELATAEGVLVVERPGGELAAVKDEDLGDAEPERAGPPL